MTEVTPEMIEAANKVAVSYGTRFSDRMARDVYRVMRRGDPEVEQLRRLRACPGIDEDNRVEDEVERLRAAISEVREHCHAETRQGLLAICDQALASTPEEKSK